MIHFQNLFNTITTISIEKVIDICIALAIVFTFKFLSPLISYILVKIFHFKEKNREKIKKHAFYNPIRLFFVVLGIYIGLIIIGVPNDFLITIQKYFKVIVIVLITTGFANVFNTSGESYKSLTKKLKVKSNDSMINISSKIIKALIYIIGGFIVVSEFGYDLGGLVTGLGITSVVIALAAQDIAKNILSGFSLLSDKPFAVGDFIKINTASGTVEEISFRYTKIRNLDNQIIIIPNSELLSNYIINGSKKFILDDKKDGRRYINTLILDMSIDIDQISILTSKLKLLLKNNPQVCKDTIKVFFNNISDNGFDIYIDFYTEPLKYNEFFELRETINILILKLLKEENINLAYNSQTVYLKKRIS